MCHVCQANVPAVAPSHTDINDVLILEHGWNRAKIQLNNVVVAYLSNVVVEEQYIRLLEWPIRYVITKGR